MTASQRTQQWVREKLMEEREKRGYACQNVAHAVEDWTLEFAHLRKTGVQGRGRGRRDRLLDIRRNPGAYVILCRTCHLAFDRGEIEDLVLTIQWGGLDACVYEDSDDADVPHLRREGDRGSLQPL